MSRILVVAPAWVGDMVMSQVLLTSLKRHGASSIDVVAPPATAALAKRMPEVRDAYTLHVGHGELGIGKRWTAARELADNGYDQAIVLPNSLKSSLLPAFAGIPLRTGFLGEMRYFFLNDPRLLNKEALPRMVDRFMALGPAPDEAITPPSLEIDRANQQALLASLSLATDKPVLAICPGAEFGEAKRWPAAHFAAVADEAVARGMAVWLFGGPGDVSAGAAITGITGQKDDIVDLTGQTSLLDAVDLLAAASLVISNDSGLMHVAAATGRRTLVVYGSTSPDFTPPLTDTAEIFRLGLDCSPCFKRVCPLGHTDCLNKLDPETLFPHLGERIA